MTKGTEKYTDQFAELVHEAWRTHVVRKVNVTMDSAAPAASEADKEYPNMPRQPSGYPHRDKRGHWPIMNAAVARAVKSAELAITPKALEAMAEEYLKLQSKGAWDLKSVEEWSVVAARARKTKKPVRRHM